MDTCDILYQRNNWCGLSYIDEPTEKMFIYQEFIESLSPWQDSNNPEKFKHLIPNPFELDFLKVTSGKLPQNIYSTGGDKLPRGFMIKRDIYENLITLISFAPHIVFPLKITNRKILNEDFYFCFFRDITDNIDFPNSTFKGYVKSLDDYEQFKATSLKDLLIKSKEKYNYSSYYDKVKFNEGTPEYDIFGLFHIDLNIYFSEKVKDVFHKLKTNEQFKDAEVNFEY